MPSTSFSRSPYKRCEIQTASGLCNFVKIIIKEFCIEFGSFWLLPEWLVFRKRQVEVPPWPLAGFVLGSPEFKSLAMLVNNQLVHLLSVGILKHIMLLLLFFLIIGSLSLKSPFIFILFILLFCHTQWITSKIKTIINRLINIKFEICTLLGRSDCGEEISEKPSLWGIEISPHGQFKY